MYNKKVLNTAVANLGKAKAPVKKKDIIVDPEGQWKYPGQNTRIPSNEITMQGVNYPVYGVDDTGYGQMMYPGMNYTFPGNYVDEYPQMQDGGDYIEAELTPEEIEQYRKGGYIVEDISIPSLTKAQSGGTHYTVPGMSNINVTKSGIFGRPKQYSIEFNNAPLQQMISKMEGTPIYQSKKQAPQIQNRQITNTQASKINNKAIEEVAVATQSTAPVVNSTVKAPETKPVIKSEPVVEKASVVSKTEPVVESKPVVETKPVVPVAKVETPVIKQPEYGSQEEEFCYPGGTCFSLSPEQRNENDIFNELPRLLTIHSDKNNLGWTVDNENGFPQELDMSKITKEDILNVINNAPDNLTSIKDQSEYENLDEFAEKYLKYHQDNQKAFGNKDYKNLYDSDYDNPDAIPYEKYAGWLNVMGVPGEDGVNDIWTNKGVLRTKPKQQRGGTLPKAQLGKNTILTTSPYSLNANAIPLASEVFGEYNPELLLGLQQNLKSPGQDFKHNATLDLGLPYTGKFAPSVNANYHGAYDVSAPGQKLRPIINSDVQLGYHPAQGVNFAVTANPRLEFSNVGQDTLNKRDWKPGSWKGYVGALGAVGYRGKSFDPNDIIGIPSSWDTIDPKGSNFLMGYGANAGFEARPFKRPLKLGIDASIMESHGKQAAEQSVDATPHNSTGWTPTINVHASYPLSELTRKKQSKVKQKQLPKGYIPKWDLGGDIGEVPLNEGRQVLRDWMYGADIGMLQDQDGGYIDTELTDEEIQAYRDAGYNIEELD